MFSWLMAQAPARRVCAVAQIARAGYLQAAEGRGNGSIDTGHAKWLDRLTDVNDIRASPVSFSAAVDLSGRRPPG